jgi:hypothetical protein
MLTIVLGDKLGDRPSILGGFWGNFDGLPVDSEGWDSGNALYKRFEQAYVDTCSKLQELMPSGYRPLEAQFEWCKGMKAFRQDPPKTVEDYLERRATETAALVHVDYVAACCNMVVDCTSEDVKNCLKIAAIETDLLLFAKEVKKSSSLINIVDIVKTLNPTSSYQECIFQVEELRDKLFLSVSLMIDKTLHSLYVANQGILRYHLDVAHYTSHFIKSKNTILIPTPWDMK